MKKIITEPSEFMEMANAFRISRIILTAYELGIFSLLEDKKSSPEIAGSIGTNPRATDRLLNAMTAIGLVEKNKDKFSNTDFSSKFLVKGRPGFMGGIGHCLICGGPGARLQNPCVLENPLPSKLLLKTGEIPGERHLLRPCMHGHRSRQGKLLP